MKYNRIILAVAIILVAVTVIAATTWDMSWPRFDQLWVGDTDDTPGNTLSTNSAYIKGDLELDGMLYADGGVSDTTGGVTATEIADVVRYVQLPLGSFVTETGGAYTPVTSSTAPGMEVDDLIPNIVWADGETTPAQISFMIPSDYSSGGAFYVLATESDSTTPNQIDFSIYNNKDATAADAAATNQTPVALAGTTSTPDLVTLTPATDIASVVANEVITLDIWRDNTADGTGDLEVKAVVFFYTATQ